jgi:N utilization substance protein B
MGAQRRFARIAAFQALYMVEMGRKDLQEEGVRWEWLEEDNPILSQPELELMARNLLYGTLENLDRIDELIQKHSLHWQLDRISRVDLSILRMAVYEMCFAKSKSPPRVVINEAVEIAKEFSSDVSYKFINGVLDAIYQKNHVS